MELARSYVDKGNLILGGAHAGIKDATIVFKAPNETIVRQFVEKDPYVAKGVVTSKFAYSVASGTKISGWEIKEWTVVVGAPSLIGKVNV